MINRVESFIEKFMKTPSANTILKRIWRALQNEQPGTQTASPTGTHFLLHI